MSLFEKILGDGTVFETEETDFIAPEGEADIDKEVIAGGNIDGFEDEEEEVESKKGKTKSTKTKSKLPISNGEFEEDIDDAVEPTPQGGSSKEDDSSFKVFIDYLELGDTEEDVEFTHEELLDKVTAKAKEEAKKADLEEFKSILDELDIKLKGKLYHVMNGGKEEDFDGSSITDIDYNTVTVTDANAEQIVRARLKLAGLEPDEIEESITQAKDLNTLNKQAEKAVPILKKAQIKQSEERKAKLEKERKAEEEKEKAFKEKIKSTVDSMKEFGGITITPKLKQTIEKNMAEESTIKKINSDWATYLTKLTVLDALGILDGDFSKIEKKAATAQLKKIKVTSSKSKGKAETSYGDFGDDTSFSSQLKSMGNLTL